MSRKLLALRSTTAIASLFAVAVWAGGCAMKAPSFSGSGLGGPRQTPSVDPQVRAPLERLRPGTPTTSPLSTRRGTVIEVMDGDTLLAISQQHKVPVSVLISENGLRDLNVFPGMRLFVPKL